MFVYVLFKTLPQIMFWEKPSKTLFFQVNRNEFESPYFSKS